METQVTIVNYEMYTSSGEKACQKLVDKVSSLILSEKRVSGEEIQKILEAESAKVAKTHREIYDTEPRQEISRQVNRALRKAGYSFGFDSYQHLVREFFSPGSIY
jgi:superfamily II RNA helicase